MPMPPCRVIPRPSHQAFCANLLPLLGALFPLLIIRLILNSLLEYQIVLSPIDDKSIRLSCRGKTPRNPAKPFRGLKNVKNSRRADFRRVRFYNEIKSTPEGAGGLWLTQKERRKGEGCSSNIVANKLLSALSRLSNDELNVFFYVLKNVDARKCAKTGKLVASLSMPGLFGELKKAGAKSINESRMRKAFVNLSKGTAGIQFREEGADFVVCAFPTFKHDRSTPHYYGPNQRRLEKLHPEPEGTLHGD
jgi:hypothetical protein